MSKSLNPYRESAVELSNYGRLSTEQARELAKMIYREPAAIRKNESVLTVKEPYLENMLEYAGYRKLRDNTYIRQNQLISSFPSGSKLAEDKFTAVYHGFNKDEKIIVNGKIIMRNRNNNQNNKLINFLIFGYHFQIFDYHLQFFE